MLLLSTNLNRPHPLPSPPVSFAGNPGWERRGRAHCFDNWRESGGQEWLMLLFGRCHAPFGAGVRPKSWLALNRWWLS
eukprot:scaffold142031_cov30-Tisochrysis_lutea.AAC.1